MSHQEERNQANSLTQEHTQIELVTLSDDEESFLDAVDTANRKEPWDMFRVGNLPFNNRTRESLAIQSQANLNVEWSRQPES